MGEGLLSEEDIAQAVALDTGLPFRAINPLELNPEVVTGALPAPFARRHTICALARESDVLTVAVANPFDRGVIADLERYLGVRVKVVIATRSDIEGINGSLYNLRTSLRAAETELTHEHGRDANPPAANQELVSASEAAGDLEPTTRPVVAALDSILHQAFEQRASDIHLEPKRDQAVVRFRVDGVLRTMHTFPRIVYQAVVSRLKMLSGLDIAEKRRPQDVRIKRIEADREIELRVSTLPTVFGEKAVLRCSIRRTWFRRSEQLSGGGEERLVREMLSRREGLVLVTGPTGSGKTTTLYSVLRHVATPEVNVVTIEDPVELVLPALSQVQVNPRIRFSFANAIRSVLRQDPDILMVGEIRDAETAEMAVQAALTGHLVLSTLHTNDAPGAITRLADLGVPRFLIGATLVGVVAQRLVRTICRRCARAAAVSASEAEALAAAGIRGRPVRVGDGCARCRATGYQGRRAVFEILPIDAGSTRAILDGCTAEDLAALARRREVLSLRQAALRLLLEGHTTVAEVIRVTGAGPDVGSDGNPPGRDAPGRGRGRGSEAERPADDQEERGDAVERHDHVGNGQTPVRHRDVRKPASGGERNLSHPGNRVDQRDPDQIEEEVDDRELESPVGVGAGNRERGEERGDRRSHVGAQGDRERVIEEQEPGSGERDQHRGGHRTRLDEDRDDRAHPHGQERMTAEHPVEGGLTPARGNALQRPDEQAERDHQQHHGGDRQNRRGGLAGAGHDAGEPLDGHRNQLDDALEGTLVVDTGPEEAPELLGDHTGEARQKPGDDLERQEDGHGEQVEHVVAGSHFESPPQFLSVPQVSEGRDRVGDGRPDVCAHHHGDGVFERQRRFGGGDQPHDQRTRDRRTLDQRRRQDSDDEPHEGVRRGLEETVEEAGTKTFESLAETVNRPQKEDEQQNQPDGARQLGKSTPARSESLLGHSVPLPMTSAESDERPSAQPLSAAHMLRFVMDE